MKLNVGDKMPNFTFNTAFKNDVTVNEVLKGKTIFWVLRYIGCTVCRWDVHCINQRYDEFKAKNAQVFVIMQSDQKHVQDSIKDEPLPFDIICDTDMAIYKALEINPAASKEEMRGDGSNMGKLMAKIEGIKGTTFTHGDYEGDELQLPAMFIVEEDGTVCYARYGKDIADLPTIDEVLELL